MLVSIDIDEGDDRQAYQTALKLEGLLKQPIVQMAIAGEGVRLAGGDKALTVHQPIPLRT